MPGHRARGQAVAAESDRAWGRVAGAASDQLYSILMDTPPETEGEDGLEAPREIGGVDPPNTLEIRWMPATGGAATVVASAQNGRGPHFTRNDSSRVYLTTNRGLQSITMDGYDRRTHLRITGAGPGNNPGRETVEVRIQGRGENTTVPVNQGSMSFFEKPMDRRRCS